MTTVDQFEDLRRSASQVEIHQRNDLWPRLGFVGRGVVYLVVAALALQIAWSGAPDTEASKEGAVRAVADQPAGQALLVGLVVALTAYALWRLGEALWGHRDELRRCAFEHQAAPVVTRAWTEIDDPVGVRHDRLMMLDDDDRFARVD